MKISPRGLWVRLIRPCKFTVPRNLEPLQLFWSKSGGDRRTPKRFARMADLIEQRASVLECGDSAPLFRRKVTISKSRSLSRSRNPGLTPQSERNKLFAA
jgi:hypothetical protein